MSDRSTGSRPAVLSSARDHAHVLAAAALGLVVGWAGTSPALSRGINWDTAGYVADLASGRSSFSSEPWSSHYALGPLYVAGMSIAKAFGGTALDGVRLLGAFALAASAALIALMARRLSERRDVAFAAAAVFVLAWGTLILTFTWEDNVLFLPFGLGALALALSRHDAWRPTTSLTAGALVGAGSLVSWQAAIYAAAPLYAALCLGGPDRRAPHRARDATLVVFAFFTARLLWAAVFGVISEAVPFARAIRIAFARPEPSFLPDSFGALAELARRWRTVLRHVGLGLLGEIAPGLSDATSLRHSAAALGATALIAAAALFALTLRRARRTGRATAHVLAAAFLFMLLATAGYVDLPTDKHKRYDFVPPTVVLLVATATRRLVEPRAGSTRFRPAVAISAAAALVLAEVVVAGHAARAHRAALPHLEPPGYHGVGAETWFAYMRRLRRETPQACGYLFAFDELRHARYQLEILAALWSELPNPLAVGTPTAVAGWPRPLPIAAPGLARATLQPCHQVTGPARAALASP